MGLPANQWISVYNARRPMKQRYIPISLKSLLILRDDFHFPDLKIKVEECDSSTDTICVNLFILLCCICCLCLTFFRFYLLITKFRCQGYYPVLRLDVRELLCINLGVGFFVLCRYHYNVSSTRLTQHIEKGNEDGLYISSVSSSQGLWALIMDAGTGFTSQVYKLSPQFLHKVNFNLQPYIFLLVDY